MSDAAKPQAVQQKSGLRIPGFAQLQRPGESRCCRLRCCLRPESCSGSAEPDLLGGIKAPVIGPFFQAMSAAGGAIFDNLPLLFAVGVAIGFAKKADGSTALAAVVGYLVVQAVFKTMSPIVLAGEVDKDGDQALINYSVLAGIVVGLLTAWLFDRYHTIQLPSYLGFFGGRRFVPIVVSVTCLFLGVRDELLLSDLRRRADRPRRIHRRLGRPRGVRLRVRQSDADPARSAPHPELLHLVPLRRLSTPGGREGRHRRAHPVRRGRPVRRAS